MLLERIYPGDGWNWRVFLVLGAFYTWKIIVVLSKIKKATADGKGQ